MTITTKEHKLVIFLRTKAELVNYRGKRCAKNKKEQTTCVTMNQKSLVGDTLLHTSGETLSKRQKTHDSTRPDEEYTSHCHPATVRSAIIDQSVSRTCHLT